MFFFYDNSFKASIKKVCDLIEQITFKAEMQCKFNPWKYTHTKADTELKQCLGTPKKRQIQGEKGRVSEKKPEGRISSSIIWEPRQIFSNSSIISSFTLCNFKWIVCTPSLLRAYILVLKSK